MATLCKSLSLILILMLWLGQASAQQDSAQSTDFYMIRFNDALDKAYVEATLHGGHFSMAPIGASHLARGWQTWVQNLIALSATGGTLPVEAGPDGGWIVDAQPESSIRLNYEVDLSFTRLPWPVGNEQAGQFTGDALYLVARPLFIVSDVDRPARIRIQPPGNMIISSAWQRGDDGVFYAENQTSLTSNSLVVGHHNEVRVSQDDFHVNLALPGEAGGAADAMRPVLSAAMADYLDMFPETPARTFLMTFFYAPQDDGEAFSGSAAFTSQEPVTATGRLIWANFIAHELMHHWNGQAIASSERAPTAWFREGGTEYLANLALARGDVVDPQSWLRKAESHLGLYLLFASSPVWQEVTLESAGSNSGANRPGVYNGGWAASLCLDARIRQASADRRSLRDLMTLMYRRYAQTGTRYTAADLASAVSEIAGEDLDDYFRVHIQGTEPLPIRECLAAFGLQIISKSYAGEAYLSADPEADGAARQRLDSLLNHPGAHASLLARSAP